ncbi:hypothetical protein [Pseudorhodoferax sp.]|uniref:hypothetical protein n=1 Tax=Pseudorhodoferax sp. TaxID=1993553 RepID=UPI002DD6760A|nr:hypothetical protein [Pseudorhodoferax sp.]
MNFAPAALEVIAYEGAPRTLEVAVKSSRSIDSVVNVGIVADRAGLLEGVQVERTAEALSYKAKLTLSTTMGVGEYRGALEIRLCYDEPLTCARPVEGAPWLLPYTIVVRKGTDLSPLRPLAGAKDWGMYQGSAQHTGYVAATVNPGAFGRRFRVELPETTESSEIAVAQGLVALVSGVVPYIPWSVHGIHEATGAPAWTVATADAWVQFNPPALADGMLYTVSSGSPSLWSFSAADGVLLNKTYLGSQRKIHLAPTVESGAIFAAGGNYGGMSRIAAGGAGVDWSKDLLWSSHWTPAVQGSLAYAYLADTLHAIHVADGATAFTIVDPALGGSGYTAPGAPAIADDGAVFVSRVAFRPDLPYTGLLRFDPIARSLSWSVATQVLSQPVVAGETVYALEGGALQARSARTGASLWSWNAPSAFAGKGGQVDPLPLVVVGDLAFFCTIDGTMALDLKTRQIVWTDPSIGRLAVSANGILYIRGTTELVAVNLH